MTDRQIDKFLLWLEEMTDFGDWDDKVKEEVRKKLIAIRNE